MTDKKSFTVGYWSIRGLGAPLRMMALYSGSHLDCHDYDLKCNLVVNEEGQKTRSYDNTSWFGVKPEYKQKNNLINLPYLIDNSNGKVIAQTNACLSYLGRKLNMFGKNEDETILCEELLCEIYDLKNEVSSLAYGKFKGDAADWFRPLTGSNSVLAKLNSQLSLKYEKEEDSLFFVGDSATAPDFFIWEVVDQVKDIIKFYGLTDAIESKFQFVNNFHRNFASLNENKLYLESNHAKLPHNNLMAVFGSSPTGHPYDPETMDAEWQTVLPKSYN